MSCRINQVGKLIAVLFVSLLLISCSSTGKPTSNVVADNIPNSAFGNLEYAPEKDNVVYAAQPDENTVRMFKQQGFDVVINIRDVKEKIGFDEEKLVLEQGIFYTHIPYLNTDEDRMINNDALSKVKQAIEEAKENNHKVLLHCSHGLRAASTLGLILYRDHGYSVQDAEAMAKSVGMRGNWIQTRFDEFVSRIPPK